MQDTEQLVVAPIHGPLVYNEAGNYTAVLTDEERALFLTEPHCLSVVCDLDTIENGHDRSRGYIYNKLSTHPAETSNFKPLKSVYRPKLFKTIDKLESAARREMYDLEYYPVAQRPITCLAIGQLKLFLSTLQFLTDYALTNGKTHVVYPGSAPGNNIEYLTELFPNCEWHLYDPRDFYSKLYNNTHVKTIINDFFLPIHIEDLKKRIPSDERLLLISDIRVCTDMSEKNIDRDMRLQEGWVRDMKPDYAQLKFRLPRALEYGMIQVGPYTDHTYMYLPGKIYLQMYAPSESTEGRIVVSKKDAEAENVEYNVNVYEAYMSFFNRRARVSVYPSNGPTIDVMDHCHDCTLFIHTVSEYNRKYAKKGKSRLTASAVIANIVNIRWKMVKHRKGIVDNLRIGKIKHISFKNALSQQVIEAQVEQS